MSGTVPAPNETRLWLIVQAITELFAGRSNAVGSVALATTPATTTTVTAPNCGTSSQPVLTPRDANAAAAIATGQVYISAVARGSFTITHPASALTRSLGYVCLG